MTLPLIEYVATRYRCQHCRKSFAAKGTAENHLGRCFANPENRTCLTCKHRTRHDLTGSPECAIGEAMWPSCAGCGTWFSEEGAMHDVDCSWRLVANYLSVRCESWEAKP